MNLNALQGLIGIGALCLCAATLQGSVVIDTAQVGNAGNAGQVQGSNSFGGVGYEFRIGTLEVTNTQYASFLNSVAATDTFHLYDLGMGSPNDSQHHGGITRGGASGSYTYGVKPDMGNKPVNFITWYDAIRFTNWMHNGQPSGQQGDGTTETGAYTLLGGKTVPTNGLTITREPGAKWFLPTENEWHKAAYYDPATANYFLYPTSNNTKPVKATANGVGDVGNPGPNVVNYLSGAVWNGVAGPTSVGTSQSWSAYGTYDQGGNVCEWTESLVGTARAYRGGCWIDGFPSLQASNRNWITPDTIGDTFGFRIATIIPEPGGFGALAVFFSIFTFKRFAKRKRTFC